jgi:hypothetical protein
MSELGLVPARDEPVETFEVRHEFGILTELLAETRRGLQGLRIFRCNRDPSLDPLEC